MSVRKSIYIQKYLNQYRITDASLRLSLIKNVGNRNPNLYEPPSPENVAKINEFIDTLANFEAYALSDDVDIEKTEILLNHLVELQDELQLTPVRPLESKNDRDWIMFIPKVIDENTPVKVGAVFVYRFGMVRDLPSDNSKFHTVSNIALISEHSISDGTESINAELFLKSKAKFILANFFWSHVVANPSYDPNVKLPDRNSIKYFSDPAHSDTTIFVPMLQNLLQRKHPKMPLLIMHGMGAKNGVEDQILMGNCRGKFRDDGWRSFANLLGISFAIEDYYTSNANEADDNPSPVVRVQSIIPNYVLKGGETVPMSSDLGDANGALRYSDGVISSNVSGHIRYFAEDVLNQRILPGYKCPDNSIHLELTGYIRTNKHEHHKHRDKFVAVILRAIEWHRLYDAAIHDPHRLSDRFIEVSRNMKRYNELFSRWKINRYIRNNLDTYNADTLQYQAFFAKRRQLPPELINTPLNDSMPIDDSNSSDFDVNSMVESEYDSSVDEEIDLGANSSPKPLQFIYKISSEDDSLSVTINSNKRLKLGV